ncbi:uncharacterized protein [Euwallacea similis]|uniref:uncharacterized protein n=1 Tax=Euwallacea similis TaxID=1736056 RepID=UPI00344DA995
MSSGKRRILIIYAIVTLIGIVHSRAVNISNTWMLPEEGFSVFYRYFRDRISWYEADAVCQFHHANLVTADTSSQYDAIRAYLKELDITEKVWIGLSKPPDNSNFIWTDIRALSGEGHWQESLPIGDSQSLCAVMDPAADFLWRALPCGGPEVAAFICELPIPSWALGPQGCLLTELPSLTVLYVPEQAALELTSDCGLDGTKRIACKGNANHEEMLKQLTCVILSEDIDDDKSTKTSTLDYAETSTWDDNSIGDGKTTKSWTSNTIIGEYGMPTRHRRETEDSLIPLSTKSSVKRVWTNDVSWQDTHKEKTVLTTEQTFAGHPHWTTPAATELSDMSNTGRDTTAESISVTGFNSVESDKEGTTFTLAGEQYKIKPAHESATERLSKLEQATTSKASENSLQMHSTPDQAFPINSNVMTTEDSSTTATQDSNAGDYPSAINQGQLFSIIENGTMFDLIELNETEQAQFAKVASSTNTHSSTENSLPPVLVVGKKPIAKKSTQTNKKTSKILPITTQITTENPATTKHIQSVDEMEENLTKEFEMMPDIKDNSPRLNRSFRKELPPFNEEHTNLENGVQYGLPKVLNFTIVNKIDVDDYEGYQGDQPHEAVNVTATIVINNKMEPIADKNTSQKRDEGFNVTEVQKANKGDQPAKNITDDEHIEVSKRTVSITASPPINPADPRIYMINHHLVPRSTNVPHANHSTVHPSTVKSTDSSTEHPKIEKRNFLPKSLLEEHGPTVTPTPQTGSISEEYSDHPFPSDEPKKINRHRNLGHGNKGRKFYPYFFSRMLG